MCDTVMSTALFRTYKGTTIVPMPKEKVTLTLDAATLHELRTLVGARSLSSGVDAAITAYVQRMRHLVAVDEWLAELERDHGPAPRETLEWAAKLVDQWDADRTRRKRRG